MFKLVKILLAAAHLFAKREEMKQRAAQEKFKKKQAELSLRLAVEAKAAHARAHALDSQAATASAWHIMGSNEINENERIAATMRNSLDFIVAER